MTEEKEQREQREKKENKENKENKEKKDIKKKINNNKSGKDSKDSKNNKNNNKVEETVEVKKKQTQKEEKATDTVEILPDVISSIVSFEIEKIPGVDRQGNILQDLGEVIGNWSKQTKGINVEINENKVIINISINVNYGIRIPDIAFEIQTKVKKAVEQMTGLDVREVNVHVKGIKFKEQEEVEEVDLTKIKVEKKSKKNSKK